MAKIIKESVNINFGNKVWSSNEKINLYPWSLVGVEGTATFDGEKGGIDMYSNFTKDDYDSNNDYCFAITVGDMKSHDENGNRVNPITPGVTGIAGNLTINGGTYMAIGSSCIYVTKGTCTINDGIFFSQLSNQKTTVPEEIEKYGFEYRNFLLNIFDTFGNVGDAKIVVNGGTFIGFDPAYNFAEYDGKTPTNFVSVGHKSVENGEYTYMIKDINNPDNGKLVTVKVYTVVPSSDEREGIEGIVE